MSFKDELDAAVASYDEARTAREALVGKEGDEVRAQVEELETRMGALGADVTRLSKLADEERAIEEARSKSPLYTPRVITESRAKNDDNAELRSLLSVAGAQGNFKIEARAVLGSADGNYTSKSFGDEVLNKVKDRATVTKAGATVKADQGGNKLSAVSVDTIATAWTARGDALPDTTTGTVKELSAYLVGGIVRVDNQQIQDSASDLVGLIAGEAGRTIANAV
ncbi:MAG: phage major capsid protein, partial [Chitinophagaceae bacterium]